MWPMSPFWTNQEDISSSQVGKAQKKTELVFIETSLKFLREPQ